MSRLSIAVALALGLPSSFAATPAAGPDWAPGHLLVMPRAGLSDADLAKIIAPHGGKARRIGRSELRIVDLPPHVSEKAVLALLARHPHLKFAELDRRVPPSLAVNDPYAGSEWHLGQIGAPAAWDISQGAGVTIAILDSGVMPTHPDLAAKLVPGWNFYDNNANTSDVYGHGTSVAGAAAAIGNNGIGVAGVAGAAKIMPIRVSDTSGMGYFSTIAQGVTYAADNGARVANASFAGLFSSASVQSAGQYLKSKGGLLVVAAGNNGIDEGAPATTSMITVSATDATDARASWSSYGSMVSVAAPGSGIWTTGSTGDYRSASGTSFASPVTAGVIALMMSARPSLPSTTIESLLFSSAVDLGTSGRDAYFGYGRVDAAAAVKAASSAPAPDAQAPTVAIAAPLGNTVATGTVLVDVSASDDVGVARVELRVNGNLVATDIAAPYQFVWNSTAVANGSATLTAVAYDAAGNNKTSPGVAVTVSNAAPPGDQTPPSVAIVNPAPGAVLSGNVQVASKASDNGGAAGISQTIYIDGAVVARGNGASLTYNWNTKKTGSGTHTVMVVAQDAAGNKTTVSEQVTK